MKAKRVYEFHKGTDPLSSLGLGPMKAKIYKAFKGLIEKYEDFVEFSQIKDESGEKEIIFHVLARLKQYGKTSYFINYNENTKVFTVSSFQHETTDSLEKAIEILNDWMYYGINE